MCYDYPDWESHEGRKRGKRCLAWRGDVGILAALATDKSCRPTFMREHYAYTSRWSFHFFRIYFNLDPGGKWSNFKGIFFKWGVQPTTNYIDIHFFSGSTDWRFDFLTRRWAQSSSQQGAKHWKPASWLNQQRFKLHQVCGVDCHRRGILTCCYNLDPQPWKASDNFWSQKSTSRVVSLQIVCLLQELVQRHHFFLESRIDVLGANHYHFWFCVMVFWLFAQDCLAVCTMQRAIF